ncbi:hypothetical protein [Methylobacter sp.]|uniref:hypothetical protein n=1 Tax=Methylobacter sp. TaxID=2051955 RepID=UPI003DA52808
MSDPVYVIELGSGLYLDDHGVLHQGPIPPVPSYTLPGGVLATANEISKLSKTFKDIGDALPNKEDGKKFDEFAAKLSKLGLPGDDMAKLLGVVGEIADAVGTVFVVVGVAMAAAKMLGLFNEGPSPLEILVKARFDALDKTINALHKLIVDKDLEKQKNALGAARSTVQDFVSQRDSLTMTPAQIESRQQELATNLQLLSAPQWIALLDPITYTVLFDSGEYEKVWPWISSHLFRVPAGSPPQRAAFPVVNSPFFDHRLAVVLAPQAAQILLVLVRSLSPEFRTTGDFRSTLRDFATKLSELATSIRNTTLARTIYTEGDFGGLIPDFYVNDPFPGVIEPTLKPDYSFVVGAMDLCNHNDAFFPNVVKGFGVPASIPSRQGSFDFRWQPPARLVRQGPDTVLVHADGSPVIQYRIVNPKDCADTANDLSLQDYSDLLLSSGYLTLVQLAVQLRHTATQPDKSETVHGDVLLQRHPQPRSEVTVVSAPGTILFTSTGEIKAQAWREPQKIRAFATCSTQLIPRTKLIHYRVLLRTLASGFPPRGWAEPDYNTAVQSASYVADPLHPGFRRLVLSTSKDAVLHEELLIEGSSQKEARHVDRTLEFKAHTFDWWIPVQSLRPLKPFDIPRLSPEVTVLDSDSTYIPGIGSVMLGIGWKDGAQTWKGYHREILETTIGMHVRLDWEGSNIRVEIENRPEDRNYIAFLVVEETFGSIEPDEQPPKVLHTAFPIAINGQLTYVPQSLFDQEKEADQKQRAFAEKYAVSVNPKPGEPVLETIRMNQVTTDAGIAHLAAALRQFEPEELEKLTRFFFT